MIQFNLLPDVKLQYMKARYRQRLAVTISFLVSGFFLVVMVLLFFFVRVGQTHHMNSLSSDIEATTNQLKETQDLDKILTIQNQLNSLPALHNNKVISSRLFDYLVQLTPKQATISDATLDFELGTINIKGNADSLGTVNKFTDTLKFTDYKSGGAAPLEGKAFSNVVLKSFSITGPEAAGQANKQITYEIDLNFDPNIFANLLDENGKSTDLTLTIPNIISTRSEKPASLFEAQPNEETGASQ